MSARMLSIDSRITLRSSGGPALRAGAGGPAAALARAGDDARAAGGAEGSPVAAAADDTAGECPEQAAAKTAPDTNAAFRRIASKCLNGGRPASFPPAAYASRTPGLRLYRDAQALPELEVRLADAVEDDFLAAFLAGDAGSVLGGAHHLRGHAQVVRQDEAGSIGGEVDPGHPLLEVDRAAGLQQLGDGAREHFAVHALKIGGHEGERLVHLALQVGRDGKLRNAQLDGRKEPRL